MWISKSGILISALSVAVLTASSNQNLNKDQIWVCVKWQWVNSALEGKVQCVEWAKKDCSNRLHKDICKLGG